MKSPEFHYLCSIKAILFLSILNSFVCHPKHPSEYLLYLAKISFRGGKKTASLHFVSLAGCLPSLKMLMGLAAVHLASIITTLI